jgi:lipopolysaccharide/colanic/teichoic acid biosynthesis glycosyltransferase
MAKRVFDIVTSVLALTLTWPLIVLGAVLVKATSSGPAFYRAPRAGQGGRQFHMFKLRTMRTGADRPDRRITADRDDRITPVGAWLRRLKLDELPQFWNVLRGDMSVVGPRPEDWEIVTRYYTEEARRSLDVRPGIVSPATVTWYPDLTYHDPPPPGVPMQEWYVARHLPVQIAEAVRYARTRTLARDLGVVAHTVRCLVVHAWLPPPRRLLARDDS